MKLKKTLVFLVLTSVCSLLQAADPVVFYAGGDARTRFHDVMQCSDGSLLVLGSSDHLDWLPAGVPVNELVAGLPVNFGTHASYLLHLSADTRQIERVLRMPPGTTANLRWIRSTSKPGEPTGALLVSGKISGGYFIGRLNGNFVDALPTGFDWISQVSAANGHEEYQPWDVAADGSVVYGFGGEYSAMIGFLDTNGQPHTLSGLRASHWTGSEFVRDVGSAVPAAEYSVVRLPTDMQSWNDTELFAHTPDGNGGVRQGSWPLDIMITHSFASGTPINQIGSQFYGYNGYRTAGRHWIGSIAVDRSSGDFYIGFNVKSVFWDAPANKEQPDFEPAVIGYHADGSFKWWNRLYTEAVDSNSDGVFEITYVSAPDQYIDGLAIDYATDPDEPQVLVAGRCHGNNTSNFWSGNAIAANPGGNGFQNRFTGTEGNIHITWLGRLGGEDGEVQNASFLAGFFRKIISGKGNWPTVAYPEPIHDGWPNHNSGWPDLTTTRIEPNSLRCAPDGRVTMVGTGPRMVTTRNAFQKLPRRLGHTNPILDEGTCPWNHWARAYEPDLASLAYSSTLTGQWTYPGGDTSADPVGASNTILRAAYAVDGGMLVVGLHGNSAETAAAGNAIPTAAVPDWGSDTFSGVTGILAFLPFLETAAAPPTPTAAIHSQAPDSLTLRFETQPLRSYRIETSNNAASWDDSGTSFIGNGGSIQWEVPDGSLEPGTPLLLRVVAD